MGPLQEQPLFFTIEVSLQPHIRVVKTRSMPITKELIELDNFTLKIHNLKF